MSSYAKVWASRRVLLSIERRIFMSETAVATIFKIGPTDRSSSSLRSTKHLRVPFGLCSNGDMFVTGPTTSSFDCIYKITPQGNVSIFFRGLGRPQESLSMRRAIFTSLLHFRASEGSSSSPPNGEASLAVGRCGPGRTGFCSRTLGCSCHQ